MQSSKLFILEEPRGLHEDLLPPSSSHCLRKVLWKSCQYHLLLPKTVAVDSLSILTLGYSTHNLWPKSNLITGRDASLSVTSFTRTQFSREAFVCRKVCFESGILHIFLIEKDLCPLLVIVSRPGVLLSSLRQYNRLLLISHLLSASFKVWLLWTLSIIFWVFEVLRSSSATLRLSLHRKLLATTHTGIL